MDANTVRTVVLFLPALVFSLCVHEYAHAWMATRLGDSTPGRQGRLTLSPMAHVDPIGSLLLPVLMLIGGGFIFGWAKPVQFNPANFRRSLTMRQGAALTAAAGPGSNVLLALVALVVLRFGSDMGWVGQASALAGQAPMLTRFLLALVELNVLLAVFNLLPLPPLDGSYLLPRSMDGAKAWLSRYSFLIFLALFFLPLPGLGAPLGSIMLGPMMHGLRDALVAVAFADL
ncbi:MAG: site-2 protease family protein [Polyangiales bacterium]